MKQWFASVLVLLSLVTVTSVQGQTLINGSRVITGTFNYCQTTGSSNAYLCTLLEPLTSYVTGQCFTFRANHTNTGAVTLNVSGLGAKAIQKFVTATATDLAANDIGNGQIVDVCYDGTILQVQSISSPGSGGGGSGDITAVGNCATGECGTAGGTALSSLSFAPITAPGNPATGRGWIYMETTSKNLAMKDDAGVIKHMMQTRTPVSNEFVTGWTSAGLASTGPVNFNMIAGAATQAQLPSTLTGRFNFASVQLTDAATVTPNADTMATGYLLTLSQPTTLNAPGGAPVQGQVLTLRITSATARALTWNAAYSAAAGIPLPLTTTGGGTEDYFHFKWNADSAKWVLIGTTAPTAALAVTAGGSGIASAPARTMQVVAATCNNATATTGMDLPTANAPTPTCLTGTNTQQATLNYADSANQFAQFSFILPTGLTGAMDMDLFWLVTTGGGSNAVSWTIATGCGATSESYDPAFNTAQTITTNALANNLLTKSTQTAITQTGCAAGEEMHVRIGRTVSDTSTATARLKMIVVTMRVTPQP